MNDRVEIASELRELRHKTYYNEEIVDNITDVIAIADPTNTFREPEDIYELLADIIDPTCHNFGGEDGTNGENYDFACSNCGYCGDIAEPKYCPNCGARVVEDN